MFSILSPPSPAPLPATRTPSLGDLTNTFILSSGPSSKFKLSRVPNSLGDDSSRLRRAHQKSLRGCQSCKRRRVKCDEKVPCGNCRRRREHCHVGQQQCNRKGPLTPMPTPALLPSRKPADASVNLDHLRLFHHFKTSTRQTLLFEPVIWDAALRLSHHFDFLMNAILCIAARHLDSLWQTQATLPSCSTTAARHLGSALTGFRRQVAGSFTSTHIDVFVATSLLLQYDVWSNVDFLPAAQRGDRDTGFGHSADCFFSFSSSLKHVFLKSVPLIVGQPSAFMPQVQCNFPERVIAASKLHADDMEAYQEFFSYDRPLDAGMLASPPQPSRGGGVIEEEPWRHHNFEVDDPDPINSGYVPAVARLCLIASFIGNTTRLRPQDAKYLARYVLSFPIMCRGAFAAMVHQDDPHALLVLYHFYRAVRMLLPEEEYWWVHKRATIRESELRVWLDGVVAEQT